MTKPLTSQELALYREGLLGVQYDSDKPLSLMEITRREWMDRCSRLLATLDAERDRMLTEMDGLSRFVNSTGEYVDLDSVRDVVRPDSFICSRCGQEFYGPIPIHRRSDCRPDPS